MESKTEVEVELEEIAPAEEKKREEEEKKDEHEEEDVDKGNVYSFLTNPSEHVYGVPSSTRSYKVNEDTPDINRKVRVYRIISLVLFVICVLLLIVVLVLFMKLTGTQSCQVIEKTPEQECSLKKCSDLHNQPFGETQHQCINCGKDWLRFDNACYFLSQNRLTWEQSRHECQRRGGDLAVITNERVQTYLNKKGNLHYWIGLSHQGTKEWTWINNTVVTVRYWGAQSNSGECAILATDQPAERSWRPTKCDLYLQYICQKV